MYDLIVTGGGVVGCSILRAATLEGYSACLVESQNDLLASASGSNSGIVCTGGPVLKESHDAGDTQASIWSADQVRQAEPYLASSIKGACHIPGEIVIDPWLYLISLAVHARENGAVIHTNFTVDPVRISLDATI
eukprot:scaffold945_cov82-Cylindrotheca_fusiformis.AAC.4